MINVVVPMGGKSIFFDDKHYVFPKPLVEINGRPMIEHVLECLKGIKRQTHFIFVINQQDADQYHLDNVLRLLTDDQGLVVYQSGPSKGAVCSVLLAWEHIDSDRPLLISNSDQVIESGLNEALDFFTANNADAGTVCFESVHPQWSYVQLEQGDRITETAEKRPISRHAIAGVYYYKHGRYFIEAATRCIEKEASVEGRYFTSLTFNELVLDGRRLFAYRIPTRNYHSFYSPERIEIYEKVLTQSAAGPAL